MSGPSISRGGFCQYGDNRVNGWRQMDWYKKEGRFGGCKGKKEMRHRPRGNRVSVRGVREAISAVQDASQWEMSDWEREFAALAEPSFSEPAFWVPYGPTISSLYETAPYIPKYLGRF
ncbi:hypothetical protein K438DRAFT_1773396 [Mycena galopus ATCC 62051]|nr:hypothetical protein K438DRAFT_1773396 [Mycena galopus ATCC 62051]